MRPPLGSTSMLVSHSPFLLQLAQPLPEVFLSPSQVISLPAGGGVAGAPIGGALFASAAAPVLPFEEVMQAVDANSAKIEWESEPACTDLGKDGQHVYGWLVKFNVNARNRFGTYTGKQSHGALIKNGAVIKALGFGY